MLRSKKKSGWRTLLVVPELQRELTVWTERRSLFEKLRELDSLMASLYKDLDSSTKQQPEIAAITKNIREVTYEMDQEYGVIGSLFRSGPRPTFFATQVERYQPLLYLYPIINKNVNCLNYRYADLYANSCYNLVHYPRFYFFRAPMSLMSHEQTVEHSATMRHKNTLVHQGSVGQQGNPFQSNNSMLTLNV